MQALKEILEHTDRTNIHTTDRTTKSHTTYTF